MSLQPFQVSPPIHNFINPRLKEKDRKKRRDEDLQERDCTFERVYGWHATTLILNGPPLSILFAREMRKNGGVRRKLSGYLGLAFRRNALQLSTLIALSDRVGEGNVA